mgnify:CR=1 FL=1
MKPIAIVFGAGSAIAQALLPHLATNYRLITVSRSPESNTSSSQAHYVCDYSEPDLARLAGQVAENWGSVSLVFCAVGLLHCETLSPEKKLADLSERTLSAYFRVNSVIPALVLKTCVPLMPKLEASKAVFLSAKIAGISDNRLGGWYGYRASKAALNMLIKTASLELARSHRRLCLVALHPGTTDSPLSAPFTASLPPERLFSPDNTADRLWRVIESLGPEDTGRFLHWDGSDLPW